MKRTGNRLQLNGIDVEVVRKDVKHVRISVHPPEARVRVSAPRHVNDRDLAQILSGRLPWIERKRAEVLASAPLPELRFVTGEPHLFGGREYRLLVTELKGRPSVCIDGDELFELRVPPGSDLATREAVLERWYRHQLQAAVEPLVREWAPRLGVDPAEVRIRRMKTRWGSCNTRARRIWLNLDLAKRSPACLEYVIVHELAHLLEGSHSRRFWMLMDEFLPTWREQRAALKRMC